MKNLLALSLVLIPFGLNASHIHTCTGDGARLSFSESSFTGQPQLRLVTNGGVTWSMQGEDITMSEEIHDTGVFVKATDQSAHVFVQFYAARPADGEEVRKYKTSVSVHDGNEGHEVIFFAMNCQSERVQF